MKQIQKLLLIGKCLGKRCLNPGWLSEDTYRNRQTDTHTQTHTHVQTLVPIFQEMATEIPLWAREKKSLPLTKMFKCILASWSRTIKNSCWEPGRKKILKDVKLYVVWMWLVISAGSFSRLGIAIRVCSLHLWVTTAPLAPIPSHGEILTENLINLWINYGLKKSCFKISLKWVPNRR